MHMLALGWVVTISTRSWASILLAQRLCTYRSRPPQHLCTPRHLKNSDIDNLLGFFEESKEILYQVLWDLPMDSGSTALVSSCHSADTGTTTNIHHEEDDSMADAKEMVANARLIDGIHPEGRIFMCVAWANLDELQLFKLFPEVMHCDATCDMSNSKNHLLTFSGRTSTAKQFIFLRIWLVNQRRSTFNWVFHVVLPTFIPCIHFQRVRLIMVDGDPQQGNEVATALTSYMPHAFLGKCGWHIIHQGWKCHAPTRTSVPTKLRDEKKVIISAPPSSHGCFPSCRKAVLKMKRSMNC
jgi:hypothetical protein